MSRDLSSREIDDIVQRTIDVPPYFPPVRAIIPADDGSLWLLWNQTARSTLATVIGREGSPIAEVSTPDGGSDGLVAIAGDYAWSIDSDTFDVPIVRRHRIIRR